MTRADAPEPTNSANALLLLGGSFLGVAMVAKNAIPPYFADLRNLLAISLVSLVGPCLYYLVGLRPSFAGDRRRFWIAAATCGLIVFGLMAKQVTLRGSEHLPVGIHDGAVQTEVAAQKLLSGENPYGADYRSTPYQALNPPIVGGPTDNVVWHHYMYPPVTILLTAGLDIIARVVHAQADFRFITMGAALVLALVLLMRATSWSDRTRRLLLILGNPAVWIFVLIGANESVVLLALVAVAWLTQQRRWLLAGMMMGIALGTKQSAWLALPLWFIWLWAMARKKELSSRGMRTIGASLIGMVALIFGPFIVWSWQAFFRDIITYASGAIPYTYPISGTTFLQYLHIWHVVPSAWTVISAAPFQLLVGLPMLYILGRWIYRNPSVSNWLLAVALFILSILLVSRYLNNNYVSLIIGLCVVAYLQQTIAVPEVLPVLVAVRPAKHTPPSTS